MQLNNRQVIWILIGFTFFLQTCAYTLNPGTTSGAKTLFIRNFQDFSSGGPPYTGQVLTEKLKTFFQQNTNLSLVNQTSDWEVSGQIIAFTFSSIAAQQNSQAGGNRLTISVKTNFVNNLDNKRNFEQVFSFYRDLPATVTPTQVPRSEIELILDQIVFDIYTRTTSDW